MNDWYFIQEKGQTVGPIPLEEMRSRIHSGKVRVFDLIYCEGDEEWKMAMEHGKLRGDFEASSVASLKDRPWICLKRKADSTELDFVTSGPFTQDEILSALQIGDVRYDDYAWKDGLDSWMRIGALEEFNFRVKDRELATEILKSEDSKKPETAKILLDSVVEFKRSKGDADESVPPEAKGPDLTKTWTAPALPPEPSVQPERRGTDRRRAPDETAVEGAPTVERRRSQRRRKKPKFDWGLAGVFLLLVVATAWLVTQVVWPRFKSRTADMEAKTETTSPQESLTSPTDAPVVQPSDAVSTLQTPAESDAELKAEKADVTPKSPPPSRPPTELFLNVQMLNSNQARIEIRTNASPDFPVYVQIVGLPGQVSEGGAFYRFTKYTPTGDATKPLDLSGLKFPQGRFILRVETGDLKRETQLKMGLNDPGYKQAVVRQRKMWAHAIWKERLQLLKLSQLLEKQITLGMIPTKKFSSKGLESLIGFKRANGSQYFMFESWWELHQIAKAAKTGITNDLLTRTRKEEDRLAVFSVWK